MGVRAQASRGAEGSSAAQPTILLANCSSKRMPSTETERGSHGSLRGTGRHPGKEGVGGSIEEGQDSGGNSSSGG